MAENELYYALYLYVNHFIGRKTLSLFSGANFEHICRGLICGFAYGAFWLTHTLTHTAKKLGGRSGKFRVIRRGMVERKGSETPQCSRKAAPHTVCNQQVRGSSPFTSSKLGGPAR